MGPEKRDPKELSPSEKFVVKQAANRISRIAGDAITAKGVYNLANPSKFVTTVITGRYVPQATITANEAFLSKSRLDADLRSSKERHVKLEVKGKPGKGKVYKSTIDFTRADRSILGRIKVKPTGKDYLHSIEDFEQREIRQAKGRRNARLTIIGGRALRYGVPVLMVGWTIYDVLNDNAPKRTRRESVAYGVGGWVIEDTKLLAGLAISGVQFNVGLAQTAWDWL